VSETVNQDVIQLFRPTIGEEEIQAVSDVLRSGWLGLGPKTAQFEEAFAAYIGAKHVVGTISCTSALDLAVRMLDLRPGDEIAIPANTFVSTGHVVMYNQCRPVFVDVDPQTLSMSATDLERKLSSRTKAVIVVHYSGRPADLDAIQAVTGSIPIIEDCAHATGARYKGKHVGSLGVFGCFSFHAVKNLTMGEGGAICMNGSAAFDRAKQLRWLGIDKGTWERTPDNKEYWWEYTVNEVGL
jgi:perosamine synthetase